MRTFLQTALLACGVAAGLYAQADRVPSGSEVVVRTNEVIDAKSPSDSRIYSAVVDRDVTDRSGRVVIPRGSNAELILRDSSDNEVVLDLESVDVNGQRYTVSSTPESLTTDSTSQREGVGANKRTGKYVGGGAVIGSIIGAIAGGGKGAAIGAATGAGAGAVTQTVTRGGKVRVPAETLLTFRLDRGLRVGAADDGYTRDGRHYHRNDRDSYRGRTRN
jgi:bifunctional DNA-binding transcriptional regulator/antitoxin component of YhaV-PrlF toxin-antitoxin module